MLLQPQKLKKVILPAVIICIVIAVFGFINRGPSNGAKIDAGFARQLPQTLDANRLQASFTGECFSGYALEEIGGSPQGQSYGLTFMLRSDPKFSEELNDVLAQDTCVKESGEIMEEAGKKTENSVEQRIKIFYLTNSGSRIIP